MCINKQSTTVCSLCVLMICHLPYTGLNFSMRYRCSYPDNHPFTYSEFVVSLLFPKGYPAFLKQSLVDRRSTSASTQYGISWCYYNQLLSNLPMPFDHNQPVLVLDWYHKLRCHILLLSIPERVAASHAVSSRRCAL